MKNIFPENRVVYKITTKKRHCQTGYRLSKIIWGKEKFGFYARKLKPYNTVILNTYYYTRLRCLLHDG